MRAEWKMGPESGVWIGYVVRRQSPGLPTTVGYSTEILCCGCIATMPITTVELPTSGVIYSAIRRLSSMPSPSQCGIPHDEASNLAHYTRDFSPPPYTLPPPYVPPPADTTVPNPTDVANVRMMPTTARPPPVADPADEMRNAVADEDSDDEEADNALNGDLAIEAGFPTGDCTMPTVAQAFGRHLTSLHVFTGRPPHVPALAWSAVTPETRACHRRILQSLSSLDPNHRLATACVEQIRRAALERRWRWATTLRNAASLQGALANLPLYTTAVCGVALRLDPVWANFMGSLRRRSNQQPPREPLPLKTTVLQELLLHLPPTAAAMLSLTWATCARLGDVTSLRAEDVCLSDMAGPTCAIAVRFLRGKSVLFRGPYTVHPTVPLRTAVWLRDRRALLRPHQPLFSISESMLISTAMKSRGLEVRSIRRGALQCLSQTGCSEELLMQFSGHTQVRTLRRYLNWGQAPGLRATTMANAGLALNH